MDRVKGWAMTLRFIHNSEVFCQKYVKFSFSEKATKIWSYHPLDLTFTLSKYQIKWVITLNFCGLLRKAELYISRFSNISILLCDFEML